ncbi:MAG: hypothetical protein Q4B22_07785 [Eubacteriales bacterium]|nr:hypothetical protein [Eubacteriales bacterium]
MKKKIWIFLLTLVLACSLGGCGIKDMIPGLKQASNPDEENQIGRYEGYAIDILGWEPINEVYGEGDNYLELKKSGKGTICLDGDSINLTWEDKGDHILQFKIEGQMCEAKLLDNVIYLEFFGFSMTFVKEGTEAPGMDKLLDSKGLDVIDDILEGAEGVAGSSKLEQLSELNEEAKDLGMKGSSEGTAKEESEKKSGDAAENTAAEDAKQPDEEAESAEAAVYDADFWRGDWYGWVAYADASSDNSDWIDNCWDACGQLTVNADGTGSFMIWDSDTDEDKYTCLVDVRFNSGRSGKGSMRSVSGSMLDGKVGKNAWTVDPADSEVSAIPNMIMIKGRYVSPSDSNSWIEYIYYLRPWGTDWSDIAGIDTSGMTYPDMMPTHYEDWYKPLLDKGVTKMPNSWQEGERMLAAN